MLLISSQVISLELSTGIPMLYIFKEGRFIRRGSPVAPSEAGVYAYTRVCLLVSDLVVLLLFHPLFVSCTRKFLLQTLALYRQKLDEMVN